MCASSGTRRRRRANTRTHGVTFGEAVTVLEDDFGLTRDDPAIADEPRFDPRHLSLEGEQTPEGQL